MNTYSANAICQTWIKNTIESDKAILEQHPNGCKLYWMTQNDEIPFFMWSTCSDDGLILEWTRTTDKTDMRLTAIGQPYKMDKHNQIFLWSPSVGWYLLSTKTLNFSLFHMKIGTVRNLFLNTVQCGVLFTNTNENLGGYYAK